MQLTHLGHAAVLVETDGVRLLLDPGNMSGGAWADLTDLDAVLITHLHADHLDPQAVPALLAANPRAHLVVEPSILDLIAKGDLPDLRTEAGPAQALAPDDQVGVGGLTVAAVGGRHAVIHADLPRVGNVGYVISGEGEPTLFHPGDSYEATPEGIDVLAVPVHAPWAALKETIDFARAVGAPRGLPIHDELLKDGARAMMIDRVTAMTPTQLTDLRGAGPQTL